MKKVSLQSMDILELIFFVGVFSSFFQFGRFFYYFQFGLSIFGLVIFLLYKIIFKSRNTLSSYTIFIMIWLLWSIISIYWIYDIESYYMYNRILFIAFSYSCILSYLVSKKGFIERVILFLKLIIAVHALIGCFEILTGRYYFTSNIQAMVLYARNRFPVSFFYNTNDFATFLVFGFTVYLFDKNTKFTKVVNISSIFNLIILILISVNIYFTDSRLGMLSMVLLVTGYIYINSTNYFIRKYLTPFISLILLALVIYLGLMDNVSEFISQDGSGSIRTSLIMNGLHFLKLTDFIGTGAGNTSFYMQNFYLYRAGTIYALHNWWIEVLATYGIYFFLFYIIYYLRTINKGIKINNKNSYLMVSISWIIIFVIISTASSSIFPHIWIWIINAFSFILINSKGDKNENMFYNN